MHFLDTHIVVWLYQMSLELLSREAKKAIEENDIFVSPIVILELQYLFEIGRTRDNSQTIIEYLQSKIELKIDNANFVEIINAAINETWTRDPFDRIIVAHATYRDAYLVTKDEKISDHYLKVIF
jgi:PIN domain nuclease of toxin-antitoxin system